MGDAILSWPASPASDTIAGVDKLILLANLLSHFNHHGQYIGKR